MQPKGIKMYTGSSTWIILSSLIVCGVSEFTCPKVAELGSSVQLLCTYSNPTIVYYSSSGSSGTIAACDSNKCINVTEGYYPTFISVNKSKLEIRKVQLKDGGDWICQAGSTKLPCTLVLTQTPTCHITSGNDTHNLDIQKNISLSVNVTDYYCSTSIDFLLRAGNTEEILIKQTTVKERNITSDVFNSTFKVTESHIGSMELIFTCNNVRKAVQCGGVQTLQRHIECGVGTSSTLLLVGTGVAGTLLLVGLCHLVVYLMRKKNTVCLSGNHYDGFQGRNVDARTGYDEIGIPRPQEADTAEGGEYEMTGNHYYNLQGGNDDDTTGYVEVEIPRSRDNVNAKGAEGEASEP